MKDEEQLYDKCLACSACVATCPVAAVTAAFRGPKLTGPGQERFRGHGWEDGNNLDLCLNCRNCDITCPAGVPVSRINMRAKSRYYRGRRHRLRDWVLAHNADLHPFVRPVAALANAALGFRPLRQVMGLAGIAPGAPLPAYAAQTFTGRFRRMPHASFHRKAVFFPGCFIDFYEPEVGLDLVAVLGELGIETIVPEGLGCCGVPLESNGFGVEARDRARRSAAILSNYAAKGMPVLTLCPSCGLMLKDEAAAMGAEKGKALAASLSDAVEFVLPLLAALPPGRLDTAAAAGNFLYHAPCHLRAQGGGLATMDLPDVLTSTAVREIGALCCGMGGSYGFKDDKEDIAGAIGRELSEAAAGPEDTVLCECGICRVQIAHVTGKKTLHPITLVRRTLS